MLKNKWLKLSFILCFSLVVLSLITFDNAYAANGRSEIGKALCTISNWFRGNAGKGLAIAGVAIVGIAALYSQIKWSTAIIVGVGVALLFNATTIIEMLGYTTKTCRYYATLP